MRIVDHILLIGTITSLYYTIKIERKGVKMTTALVLGYSAFDLGLFSDKDPRIKLIKKAIRRDLEAMAEDGMTWLVFTGTLGFEYWALQVAKDMKADYGFQLATIFDFETHGSNWNEANQAKLSEFKQVDFVKYAYPQYEHRGNCVDYQKFSAGEYRVLAIFFYRRRKRKTKLRYFLPKMKNSSGLC